MKYLPFVVLIFALACMPAFGASSFLGGFSGGIVTPDGLVTPQGAWDFSFHDFTNLLGDNDLTAFGVTYGAVKNLEVGVSFLGDNNNQTAINGKYRVVTETAEVPTVIVGAFDVAGSVDFLNTDPGLYLLVSKNVTSAASAVAGRPSKPLRLTLGAGSGVFDGFFAGLDWTLQPQLSLIAELFSGRIGDDDHFFNVGLRYAATDALRLDVATMDVKDIAFGASYRLAVK